MSKKKSNIVLKQMRQIYYGSNVSALSPHNDFMGYDINMINTPTYHHIRKASDQRANNESDQATVENGAYLGDLSHSSLHILEKYDAGLYDRWNELFLKIVELKDLNDKSIVEETKALQQKSEKVLTLVMKQKK